MKTLKTLFTVVLSLALCVMMFSACQPSKPNSQSGSDTATTTEATTTTTETVTTTTEATTTTEPADIFTINEDRLSEIGKSYSELVAKYGEPISSRYESGGKIYYLQESGCAYFFGENVDTPFDEAAACMKICYLRADQLFNGLTEAVPATELAEMYGLEHLWSKWMEFYGKENMSNFRYGDYEILIYAGTDYQIGSDSKIQHIKIVQE